MTSARSTDKLVQLIGSCIETKKRHDRDVGPVRQTGCDLGTISRLIASTVVCASSWKLTIDRRQLLRMIQENPVLLADLYHSRSTWRLELTVVLLILF